MRPTAKLLTLVLLALLMIGSVGVQATQTSATNIAAEFRQQKRLILHQWGPERAQPQVIRDNIARIEREREFYDGAFVFLDNTSFEVMKPSQLDYNAVAKELAPLVGLNSRTLKYNFALVYNDRPADLFDDWSTVIQNWATMARAVRDAGLVGIAFDNEEYFGAWTNYPDDSKYKNRSLQEYRDQARLRGRQIMEAMVKEFPDIAVVSFHGPYLSEAKGPDIVYKLPDYAELTGPFFAGFMEGKGDQGLVIDGGEIYVLRSADEFKTAYDWQRYGLASDATNCAFIPPALRKIWQQQLSVAYGIYDSPTTFIDRDMNPTIWRSTLTNGLNQADNMVWTYFERVNMFDFNANQDWVNATRAAKQAAVNQAPTTIPTRAATPPTASPNSNVFLPLVQSSANATQPPPSPTPGPNPSATPQPTTPPAGETRDPWLWPFAQDSIWNMPIGANARYEAANFQPAGWTGSDAELFYKVPAGAPERPIYDPGSWTKRCSGTAVGDPNRRKTMPIPDDLIVPDAAPPSTPNNASAFLLPDGRTLVQLNPLARCERGGPVYGWATKDLDIKGPGVEGGHGGSGMSSFGGSIREGELTGSAPIRHALKVNVWGQKYLHYNRSDATPGYRWPALRADGYAANTDCTRWGDPNKYPCYGGANPKLEMGALLAIPPNVTEQSLGLTTPAARKLFRALQDYGAYIVDDTAWDAYSFGIQQEAIDEFQRVYGYGFDGSSGAFHDDINKLFGALAIVDNNAAGSVGGGGTPRAPLAPPFQ